MSTAIDELCEYTLNAAEDWAEVQLGDVLTFQRGFDLPHRSRRPGEIPIVTSSGIEDFHDRPSTRGPGVVTGRYGTIGEVFFVDEDYWPLNTTLYVRDFKGNFPKFIYHFLRAFDFKTHSGKSGVPGVNRNDLHQVAILFPMRADEQEKIAAALSDADALIKGLEDIIAKKRAIKQGAMQKLLSGRLRLPGFSEEWEVKRLGEVASFHKGKGLPKGALSPFGRRACIHYGELFTKYSAAISTTLSFTDSEFDHFCSTSNDVVMPTSDVTPRGLAKASCVLQNDVIIGSDILVIRLFEGRGDGTFLSNVIRFDENQVLQLVTGTTVFHLYASDMKNFEFKLPSLAEQKAIVSVLHDMEAEAVELERRLVKARQIKQGMMQELLTGRARLV
ncbi:restriction endonuclease subunit S [Sphingopyxis sp.]|uniref:restriction endonuclease subunit S n=1 Tax=Sphingopyxis sp. TaxID=1908224 RepID=UPI003120543E